MRAQAPVHAVAGDALLSGTAGVLTRSLGPEAIGEAITPDALDNYLLGVGDRLGEFVELGPGGVLSGLLRKTDKSAQSRSLATSTDFAAPVGAE